jgi:hypothetical protein
MPVATYAEIERLLEKAEGLAEEHLNLTARGREIQKAIRELLIAIETERIRAERRDIRS